MTVVIGLGQIGVAVLQRFAYKREHQFFLFPLD